MDLSLYNKNKNFENSSPLGLRYTKLVVDLKDGRCGP